MMKRYIFLFTLNFLIGALMAQNDEAPWENAIYDEQIRTVQLHLAGAPLTLPIVELKARNNVLVLEFDHLGADLKDYSYSLQHCNSDWKPSDLTDNEFVDGFTEDRVTEVANSFNTLNPYTHYTLRLPNANMRWIQSGNYLLKLFDNDNDKALVLVRRFLVVEPLWRVESTFTRPARADRFDTHHELDFSVVHKGTRVPNPQNDIKAFVLQNGRWDNAIGPLSPFITRQEELVFDFQDRIVFPAGKEWRFFDIRTFDFRGERVRDIREHPTYYEVTLQTDKSRAGTTYLYHGDLNGRFSIENNNFNQTLLQCDYARVLFSISQNLPLDDADVYVFGELSDWQLKPEFKMTYVEEAHAYVCEALLKQGYYNYIYRVVGPKGEEDEDGLEGNWYETRNQYTILVYFRPFGARFERLMAAVTRE